MRALFRSPHTALCLPQVRCFYTAITILLDKLVLECGRVNQKENTTCVAIAGELGQVIYGPIRFARAYTAIENIVIAAPKN